MRNWIKEALTGFGLAALVLGFIFGFDMTPFLFGGAIIVLAKLMMDGRNPSSRKFELVGAQSSTKTNIPRVTFSDIGGQEMAKREFVEALSFIKDDRLALRLGIRPLKGILLSGPPGTGKTLMAKAAANYTDSAFVAASGSQFVEMYAGVGAQRVRQLFKKARTLAEQSNKRSAVIFIDEIDVLGAKRGSHQGHMEYDQTLNELLTQIDGINSEQAIRVLIVAATNRSDLLDPALLRPGRFDRVVRVDLPDKEGRLHILKIHSRKKPFSEEVDLEAVARETYGFSGAHLESVLNEAAINALRRKSDQIEPVDIREAIDKVMLGEKMDRTPTDNEKRRVAFHESGHALLGEHSRPGSVSSITITSRGSALGYIRQNPADDQYLYTKDELIGAIRVCVAGAISEELIFGQRSTGAVGDIEQATKIAKKMVFAGLSPLGIVSSDIPQNTLHDAVTQIIREQEEFVEGFLGENREKLHLVAEHLLANESIDGDQFRAYLRGLAS